MYNTHVRLIFYDDPPFGSYQRWFDRIFTEPRYTDLTANLRYFAALDAAILARPRDTGPTTGRAAFQQRYLGAVAREKSSVDTALSRLTGVGG
jgi:hypothetical protein